MQDELTTEIHSESTISFETERKHTAFAVFQLVSERTSLEKALDYMKVKMTVDDLRSYAAEWNEFSTRKIVID